MNRYSPKKETITFEVETSFMEKLGVGMIACVIAICFFAGLGTIISKIRDIPSPWAAPERMRCLIHLDPHYPHSGSGGAIENGTAVLLTNCI